MIKSPGINSPVIYYISCYEFTENVGIVSKAPLCKGGCQPKADWGIVIERKFQSLYSW